MHDGDAADVYQRSASGGYQVVYVYIVKRCASAPIEPTTAADTYVRAIKDSQNFEVNIVASWPLVIERGPKLQLEESKTQASLGALNSSVARVQLTSSAHGRVLSFNLTNSKQVSRIVGELISAKLFVAVPLSCLFRRRVFGVYLEILATESMDQLSNPHYIWIINHY